MSAPKKRYSFGANGILQDNNAPAKAVSSQLTVVSSMEEAVIASNECQGQFKLNSETVKSIDHFQSDEFVDKFKAGVDGGENLDGLTQLFAQLRIPIGMLTHAKKLKDYNINLIIDDSGSMRISTKDLLNTACQWVQSRQHRFLNEGADRRYMTRYEEAENRLHTMLDLLAHIPTGLVTMSGLNNSDVITIERSGLTPEQFKARAHQEVIKLFSYHPKYQTPTYRSLYRFFYGNKGVLTSHYLFTDGLPHVEGDVNESVSTVGNLIQYRPNPYYNALTLISCTDQDHECAWMKDIEEVGPYTAEVDDYESEKAEILKDQGPVFPFTRGLWLFCHWVQAICPDDLDCLDESIPLTRMVFSVMVGRELTPEEYNNYWNQNRNAHQYTHLYQQFLTENSLMAKQIIQNSQKTSIYQQPPQQVYYAY